MADAVSSCKSRFVALKLAWQQQLPLWCGDPKELEKVTNSRGCPRNRLAARSQPRWGVSCLPCASAGRNSPFAKLSQRCKALQFQEASLAEDSPPSCLVMSYPSNGYRLAHPPLLSLCGHPPRTRSVRSGSYYRKGAPAAGLDGVGASKKLQKIL